MSPGVFYCSGVWGILEWKFHSTQSISWCFWSGWKQTLVRSQCFMAFQVQYSGAGQTTQRRFELDVRQPTYDKSIFQMTHTACLARTRGGQSFFGGILKEISARIKIQHNLGFQSIETIDEYWVLLQSKQHQRVLNILIKNLGVPFDRFFSSKVSYQQDSQDPCVISKTTN